MLQAFLAWSTSHVLSMGPCCDDHRQPRRCGQSCASGCTSPVLWHSVCADNCPRFPSRKYPAVLLPLRTRGRPSPRVAENAPQTAVRHPRVQIASLQVRPRVPDTPTRQTPAIDGDIPRGRVRVLPGGGIRRRRGQQSRPPTRETSPAAQKCPHTRRMSPAATPECGASIASRATGAPTAPAPTSNHDLRASHRRQKRPDSARRSQLQGRGGSQPWGKSTRPRRPDPGGVDPAGCPVSTALTSTSPTSERPARIVGMLRFLIGVRWRRGADVSTMDTRDSSGLAPQRTVSSRATVPAPRSHLSERLRREERQGVLGPERLRAQSCS